MHTELCDRLGIEFPIFAFSHCRDVVAAVTKAGGFGVLGALAYPAAQLEYELKWIDAQVGDKPYGVDIVIPGKYEGMGEIDPVKLEQQLIAAIPQAHRAFVDKILERHGIPDLPAEEKGGSDLLGWTAATAAPQIDVALRHPKVKLIANALGTPPPDVIERVHDSGRLMAALCGATKHALAQKKAGVDILIAQGHEGGGHCGEIGSMVLWPEVVDAVAPIPVLAAGGIGTGRQIAAALAMGAQGVWTGSIWLTVQEAESTPAQREAYFRATSSDTVRSRSFTGKPARMLRNGWTQAWEEPDAPKPLPMPMQYIVAAPAAARARRYGEKGNVLGFNPVGQIVGRMNEIRSVKEVVYGMVEDYLAAVERLDKLTSWKRLSVSIGKWRNTMSEQAHAIVERRGHVLTITLNRPEARNALSTEMMEIMSSTWDEVNSNADIRVAIITGAGGAFCAGADLKAMTRMHPGRQLSPGQRRRFERGRDQAAAQGISIDQAADCRGRRRGDCRRHRNSAGD